MLKINFLIFVERDSIGYYAYVPALKGIHVPGDSEEEAVKNAEDGIFLYMESILERGDPLSIGSGERTDAVGKAHVRTLYLKTHHFKSSFELQWDSQSL
ncbi:MAG: type II toxin-antitoxin system HicB family antitoxin [Bacteroidetes bacterium]|nr:type II toxin-antitoxin system HicB family antitoxin [Bacteroidota bacterium]